MIQTEDRHLPHLIAHIKNNVREYEGKQVQFTEIRGRTRIAYKGVLTGVFDKIATITLDPEVHGYDTYAFSYVHLLLGEGNLSVWDKENDENLELTKYIIEKE